MDPYRRCTAALQMSSCYSRSWSPPTAADTRPGWRTSPPGKWCLGLSMEIKSNFVSRLSPTATTAMTITIIKLHRPRFDSAVKLNATLYILTIGCCKLEAKTKHRVNICYENTVVNNVIVSCKGSRRWATEGDNGTTSHEQDSFFF